MMKRWTAAVVFAACLSAGPASGFNKYLVIPSDAEVKRSPAHRYANMGNDQAFAELERRRVKYHREPGRVRGVRAPIRLDGPINGVFVHSVLPAKERPGTPFEILDARLALSLYDLAKVLKSHDIVEVVHFTMYRPPHTHRKDPNYAETRHPGGMAIDLGAVKKRNGDWLAVGPHWQGKLGAKTCGVGARKLLRRRARELISIACEVADQRLFHYMLTPHYDKPHADHWHLEIKPNTRWFLVN